MACGSCGGSNRATSDYEVRVNGAAVYTGGTVAEARMWIAKNVSGQAATIKAVPKKAK